MTPSNQPYTRERETVAQLNRDALSAVMGETRMQLPAHALTQWRPTVRITGYVRGVTLGNVWCLATDGNLGLFTYWNGLAFIGHVQHFEWTEPLVTQVTVVKKHPDGTKTVRAMTLQRTHGAPPTLYTFYSMAGTRSGDCAPVSPKGPKKLTKVQQHAALLASI